ncbi:unnamed protein product [Brassica oleracea]
MSLLKIPMTKPSSVAQGVSMWEWSGSAFDEGGFQVILANKAVGSKLKLGLHLLSLHQITPQHLQIRFPLLVASQNRCL